MSVKSTKKHSESRTNRAKLHQQDDKDINYLNSPPTTKEFWKDAEIFTPAHNTPSNSKHQPFKKKK